jgi:acetyl esterase/lipase
MNKININKINKINTNKITSWTPLFTSIMKILQLGGKMFNPNAKTLRLFTSLRIDKIILPKPTHIKYHKVNSNILTNSNMGEWIWNTHNVLDRKSHTHYIFYIHGGAFCAGNTYNARGFLYQLAERTNSVIFSSNYRKAPEFKYPIPLTDCIMGYEYFISKIKNLDTNPLIIIAGDSAGGNLSINLIAHLIKTYQPIPSGCILISPWVNLTDDGNTPSWVKNCAYDFVKYDLAKFFAHEYINPNITNLRDVSPLYLEDDILSKFPPVIIEYGDYETLRDQITQFAIKLVKLGTDVIYNSRYEMTHNYPLFYFTKIQQADEFFISIKEFIKKINKT